MIMDTESEWITTREFVEGLFLYRGLPVSGALDQAGREGWVDAQDVFYAEEPLTRRSAAVILHRFLLKVLAEKDEEDISCAKELRDLYDCRVCVNHIAQVYAKGIMECREYPPLCVPETAGEKVGNPFRIFDGWQNVDRKSAEEYIGRTFHKREANPQKNGDFTSTYSRIPPAEAL